MKELLVIVVSMGLAEARARLLKWTSTDAREVERLRDFWVAMREATWYTVNVPGTQPARHCRICDAWEVAGCRPKCPFAKWPRRLDDKGVRNG